MSNVIMVGLIALIVGGGAGYAIGTNKPANTPIHTDSSMSMGEMMDSMNAELEGKQGDDFDKAFLDEMTLHHMGAIEMAEMAVQNAGHEEIKNMANAIITAQDGEIKQMQGWKTEWYGEQTSTTHGTH